MAVAEVVTANTDAAPDSVPRRVFDEHPSLEIEVERFVPLTESGVPYFWVWSDRLPAIERTLEGYDEVSAIERLETVDQGALYRFDWQVDSPIIGCIDDAGSRLVAAHGNEERWKLTVWFEHGEDASALLRCCRSHDVPVSVDSLRSVAEMANDDDPVLTDPQREALFEASEHGYFEQPRAISQRELAERLDISAAALGVRLRRGTGNLVVNHFSD